MADLTNNRDSGVTASSLNGMEPSGFSFENYARNMMMTQSKEDNEYNDIAKKMGAMKTGTTICGAIFKDGVVLGADTRATSGSEVAEKKSLKIKKIADNIYACGAGTAADTEYCGQLCSSQLEILKMETHAHSPLDLRVVAALTRLKRLLFRYQGYISAALVLGGVDNIMGPQLYSIHPHGSTGRFPFTAMGSGSLAAMAILENGWTTDMNEADCVKLVQRAIRAGIFNDLGSGSNVDICIMRTDGTVDYHRPYETPNLIQPYRDAIQHSSTLSVQPGTTPVISSSFTPHKNAATLADVTVTEMEE